MDGSSRSKIYDIGGKLNLIVVLTKNNLIHLQEILL